VDERRRLVPYGGDQLRMLLQVVEQFHPSPQLILDLGCGDGILARTVLELHPEARAILLDHSEPMLERAQEACASYGNRCLVLWADLSEPLAPHLAEARPDLIISGYAIHHLPHDRKRALYAEIFELLPPGGLFVHLEHVASATPAVEALFDRLYIDHLTAGRGLPREQVEAEYHGRPDKADNRLLALESQLEWLREIGFQNVDCYFKWLELAVFGGTRSR
jgi:ubiquinone/menaquinone biosynthesis C-methylase UbiE